MLFESVPASRDSPSRSQCLDLCIDGNRREDRDLSRTHNDGSIIPHIGRHICPMARSW